MDRSSGAHFVATIEALEINVAPLDGSDTAVPAAPADRSLLFQLKASRCIAANSR
jgi:hypothetical protein